ncbi:epoxide hydrolase family protein [Cryptosporangium aurantiacum]|uniref:Pimeloyl-ACP methyl ester carboxylesterase n=1 Tax=Cryptosporangium aurantiacum TaxID=134849 RepID=A0A1M7RB75_9ACTN|nr:epoxide hydrolase family protein [Cryptosporangium aurantiacum]SHN43513.1 Pimeloyl-ACP methyl ester carboxylesterase [Cryptosporangium aurantiacum]
MEPYRIEIPQPVLDDLADRLARTRWTTPLPGPDWQRGVPVDYLRDLAAYWADGYDWRAHEAELNRHPQFVTEIDGQRLHFLHVRSPHENALPLLLSHGWPGSVVEFLDVIGPLTEPSDPADAFHLIIPSLPGFGPSGPVREPGWGVERIAAAFAELMRLLGYDRYGAQGGDFGAVITPALGRLDAAHVVGVHVNAATGGFMAPGLVEPDDSFSAVEKERLERVRYYRREGNGYFKQQGTRPQTLAYGLSDSPVGQLAWIVEKFYEWTHGEGVPVDRDRLLTNVMLYWLTDTAGSSANLYYEILHSRGLRPGSGRSPVPTGVAVFAEDMAIRRYAEAANTIVHWTDFPTGGHFAALETPDLLVGDVRKFFRALR